MYTTLPSGQAAVGAVASPVAGLRAALTALTFGNVLSEDEQLRANHSIYECEDVSRLTRWLVNVRAELARRAKAREIAAVSDLIPVLASSLAPSPIHHATAEQKTHLLHLLQQPHVTRAQQTQVLVGLNRMTVEKAAALLRQLTLPPWLYDRPAWGLDLRVAAVFRPAMSLTYADLVRG